jgi:PAS domain S-box-containing protein
MASTPTFLTGESAYRSLVEHSLDAVLLTAPDGRIVMANAAAVALFGYTEQELRELGRPAVVDPSDPRLEAGLEERRRTGRFTGELTMRRKDGSRLEVELSSAIFRDEQGAEWTSMFIRDVSGRKASEAERLRAAAAIRENERLLNGIFELLPVGIWIADRSGRIVRNNPAGERIWGGARHVGPSEFDEYRGWWADTGRRITADEWALARALATGETSIGEVIRIQCFDGSFKTIINSALPLRDERGEFAGAIVVNQDITHLKETEEALRRAVESREQVLGVVAHDLRSPLQAMLTRVQLLLRAGSLAGADRANVEQIERQAKRMDRLIQDLLDVTRIEAGTLRLEMASLPPQALVEEIWQAHGAAAAAASIALDRDVPAPVPDVHADRERIVQVLDNLIENAVKFTPAGGRITIGARPAGDRVEFRVSDTGAGMAPHVAARVFERLWQAGADRRGVGLGLAIARSIVEAHGGRIWVESEPGRGSTFYFTLPAAAPRP